MEHIMTLVGKMADDQDIEHAINQHVLNTTVRLRHALHRVANVADTAASILHKTSPEEARLFKGDADYVRSVLKSVE